MDGLLQRLWRTSPAQLSAAAARRINPPPQTDSRPVWTKIQNGPLAGRELLLAPQLGGAWLEMAEGRYDGHLFDQLQPGKWDGAVFWDIGTHFGFHSLSFAALAGPTGEVRGFEPNPANRERLVLNLGRNPDLAKRISIHPVAVADKAGQMNFVFSEQVEQGDSSCSFLDGVNPPREREYYSTFKSQSVPVETLDAFASRQGIRPPQVLKIDVEGAEAMVLAGGQTVLQEHRPLILMEVHNIQVMIDVGRLLYKSGYTISVLDDPHSTTSRCFIAARPTGP